MSQCQRLLARLERGPITPMEAWNELGIYRLASMKHLIAIAAIAISTNSFAQNCTQVGNTVMCDNGVSYNRIGNTTFGSDGSTATDIGNTRFYDDGSTSTKIGNTRFYDNGETSTQIGGTRFNSDGTTCTQIGNMVSCF